MPLLRRDSETLTAENRVELRRSVHWAQRQDVAGRVERQANFRVPERLHDGARIDSLGDEERYRAWLRLIVNHQACLAVARTRALVTGLV